MKGGDKSAEFRELNFDFRRRQNGVILGLNNINPLGAVLDVEKLRVLF